MTKSNVREAVGKALRPVLESTALDRFKYIGPARRYARDWAVALGFWDDGVLGQELVHGVAKEKEISAKIKSQAAPTSKRALKGSLTLYVDPADAATDRMKTLLGEVGAPYSLMDIGQDDRSRKWLAEKCDGARPPQLFLDGQRVGGLDELRRMREEGKLDPLLFTGG